MGFLKNLKLTMRNKRNYFLMKMYSHYKKDIWDFIRVKRYYKYKKVLYTMLRHKSRFYGYVLYKVYHGVKFFTKKYSYRSNLLLIKKKLKLFYGGLLDSYIGRLGRLVSRQRKDNLVKFFSILEKRIDVLLYRSLFSYTIRFSKLFIYRRLILVNNLVVKRPSFIVAIGEMIRVGVYPMANLFFQYGYSYQVNKFKRRNFFFFFYRFYFLYFMKYTRAKIKKNWRLRKSWRFFFKKFELSKGQKLFFSKKKKRKYILRKMLKESFVLEKKRFLQPFKSFLLSFKPILYKKTILKNRKLRFSLRRFFRNRRFVFDFRFLNFKYKIQPLIYRRFFVRLYKFFLFNIKKRQLMKKKINLNRLILFKNLLFLNKKYIYYYNKVVFLIKKVKDKLKRKKLNKIISRFRKSIFMNFFKLIKMFLLTLDKRTYLIFFKKMSYSLLTKIFLFKNKRYYNNIFLKNLYRRKLFKIFTRTLRSFSRTLKDFNKRKKIIYTKLRYICINFLNNYVLKLKKLYKIKLYKMLKNKFILFKIINLFLFLKKKCFNFFKLLDVILDGYLEFKTVDLFFNKKINFVKTNLKVFFRNKIVKNIKIKLFNFIKRFILKKKRILFYFLLKKLIKVKRIVRMFNLKKAERFFSKSLFFSLKTIFRLLSKFNKSDIYARLKKKLNFFRLKYQRLLVEKVNLKKKMLGTIKKFINDERTMFRKLFEFRKRYELNLGLTKKMRRFLYKFRFILYSFSRIKKVKNMNFVYFKYSYGIPNLLVMRYRIKAYYKLLRPLIFERINVRTYRKGFVRSFKNKQYRHWSFSKNVLSYFKLGGFKPLIFMGYPSYLEVNYKTYSFLMYKPVSVVSLYYPFGVDFVSFYNYFKRKAYF